LETAEEVEGRYVSGKFVRESDYKPPKRGYPEYSVWATRKQFCTGRLRLQVYSAYRGTSWRRYWDEKDQSLDAKVAAIVIAVEKSVAEVCQLISQERAERERRKQQWAAEHEIWLRREKERRTTEARKQSQEELLRLMAAWAEAKSRETFFAEVERKSSEAPVELRERLVARIEQARTLLSSADVLEQFVTWKTPQERLNLKN